LNQLLRVKPDIRSMAEVGSGTGHFLRVAVARGIEVKGFDLADHRTCGREAAFECAQDPFSSLGASQWDAVSAFHVLEHCSDPLGAIRSMLASLVEGGIVFVEVPGILEETPPIPCMIDPRHQWYFSEKTLRNLVGKAGGKVVAVERVGPTQSELESAATAGRRMTRAWSWLKGMLPAKCLDLARGLLRPQRERGMRLMSGFTGSRRHSDVPLNLCIFFERMA
jgi:SAM-dependent methyltransferase